MPATPIKGGVFLECNLWGCVATFTGPGAEREACDRGWALWRRPQLKRDDVLCPHCHKRWQEREWKKLQRRRRGPE